MEVTVVPCWWILKTTACGPDARRRRRLLRAVLVGASSGARRRAWGLAMDGDSPNKPSKMGARLWQHGTAALPPWLHRRKLPTPLPNDRGWAGMPLLPPSLQSWEADAADTSKQIRTPHVHEVAERNSFMEEVKLERERQQKGNHVC
ncbi:uncharacterized protein [Miscanthus floridulus]|uniref:uncharacterized protein isoform X2 n=1 Tax=Miscanthus floridulus TaxID=154761 RepID=UPI00345B48F2